MIVIADTSPLSYLITIGELEVLPRLYQTVIVPLMVCDELKRPGAPVEVRQWINRPPDWLDIRTPLLPADPELIEADLDEGERDAILLAQELGADELIIDDMSGRKEAQRRNLHFIGTLGVLRTAASAGLLDFRAAIERLRETNFYVRQAVIDQFMKDFGV
ncbi:MAG TPA: DUF3368 domain-containing protein [Bryobacteraceae bacterium]|jgi:predicted nucleic acid-binding protein|nr:DUF3368 domain-containing protein [Bryobacteraceae bacterium]